MKSTNNTRYKNHEFGIEDPDGILMESTEEYIEEMNELLAEIERLKAQINK